MSSEHNFTDAELVNSGVDPIDILYRAKDAGYTPLGTHRVFSPINGVIVVVNEAVDRATLLADLEAADTPILSLSPATPWSKLGNNVESLVVTLSDSRGAAASGKAWSLMPSALISLSAETGVLDGSGQASITIGPSGLAGVCSNAMDLEFSLDDDSARPISTTFRWTG